MKQHLKIWEISLLFALCVTLCTGLYAKAAQNQLSGELVRLHVIANSDCDSDQSAKLKVRDSVLTILTPELEGVRSLNEAEAVIDKAIPQLNEAAAQSLKESGKYYPANAKLCVESYPTRNYDGFSLPAGDYVSLQIILGEGKGHNWWCVVFPPLCMTTVEDKDAFSGLPKDSEKLITSDKGGYKVKFRIIELYGEIKQALT